MEIQYGHERYWTSFFQDNKAGLAGVRLHRESVGQNSVAVEVIYWDATGGFTVKTLSGYVPVDAIEMVIAEAKNSVTTR